MNNPLKSYFRQPAIYVSLPSKGRWYPPGSLTMNDQHEVGIMPMTARDELTIKTPDALMNGQATVDVIKSCVPDIKDPWKIPSVDTDSILLGIRLATYGDQMEITSSVPKTRETQTVNVNLTTVLDQIGPVEWQDELVVENGLKIYVKPMDYQHITQNLMKTYEEQRLIRTVNSSTMDETEKLDKFQTIFSKLSAINVDSMITIIEKIVTQDGKEVTDRGYITEFVYNMDSKIATRIKDHIANMGAVGTAPPVTIQTTTEQRELGADDTYDVAISFDNSNFFA